MLSVIGDINDFASEKKLASYFGLVPWVDQSNAVVKYGAITKRGNTLGRSALAQCSLIAAARKLLGIIYHTLKNGWVFEDFPDFVIKGA